MSLPSTWPPHQSPADEAALLHLATDYALSTGLVLRPTVQPGRDSSSQTAVIHAPYSLYPSPFPRHLFEQAKQLQPLYNALYAHATVDDAFLREVVGGAVSKVDEFQGELYKIWEEVKKEGVKQPLHLGLFRSDYLIHAPPGAAPADYSIKQVEFNTISSSFGALSTRVADLHRFLYQAGEYPSLVESGVGLDALPANPALEGLAAGLAAGHKAYGNPKAKVLMVVQDNERNAFDQRPLEWQLVQQHGVSLLRIPFSALPSLTSLSPTGQLLVSSPSAPLAPPTEVSVVYYRAGYAPTDYPTPDLWALRLLIERSAAIKCPSVALQLAGAKKVQQVLAGPGRLEAFLGRGSTGSALLPRPVAALGARDAALLRESFTALYPLDDSEIGKEAQRLAVAHPERFVLKPQREGGGNNVYRADIPPALAAMAERDTLKPAGEPREREGYILMDLILPPEGREAVMVRGGAGEGVRGEVVSELGVYGVALFGEGADGGAEVLANETVGHLLRTKGVESDEGGVAVGYSVIDGVLLV